MTDDYTPLTDTPDPIEARLRDIEQNAQSRAGIEDISGSEIEWLVALVRRYRAALERIADEPCTRYVRGNDGISRVVVRHQAVAREALNEEG